MNTEKYEKEFEALLDAGHFKYTDLPDAIKRGIKDLAKLFYLAACAARDEEKRELVEALREVSEKKAKKWHPCDPVLEKINAALAKLGVNHEH